MPTLRANVSAPPAQLSFLTERKHEAAYRQHRAEHPEVFDRLVAMARQVRSEGWSHCSFRMIWENARREMGPRLAPDDYGFKLNDWYAPFYSREIMRECADLRGMFEIRERS